MADELNQLRIVFEGLSNRSSYPLAKNCVLPLFEYLGWGGKSFSINVIEKSQDTTLAHLTIGNEVGLNLVIGRKRDSELIINKKLFNVIEDSYNRRISWSAYSNFESLWVSHTLWNLKSRDDLPWKWNIGQKEYQRNINLLKPSSFINGDIDKAEETSQGHNNRIEPIDRYFVANLNNFRKLFLNKHADNFANKELLELYIHELFSRLIFIRTCEDRGLSNGLLSLKEIRDKLDKKNSTSSLFSSLCTQYKKKYNSELFENDLFSFDNDILRSVISFLFQHEEFGYKLDFTKIDVDILGMIYEQYLKFIGWRQEKSSKQLPLTMEGYSAETYSLSLARKEKGVFFTPQYIVNFILNHTLRIMLSENQYTLKAPPKIADISCGSGIFLVKAYELLHKYYKNHKITEDEIQQYIPLNSLYAVDIDPKAVLSARLNLWLRFLDQKKQLIRLRNNFIADDSLLARTTNGLFDEEVRKRLISERASEILQENYFDVIVGNPPYINSKDLSALDAEREKRYKKLYDSAQKSYDMYFLFLEEAIRIVKPGGYIGYIVSNRFLKSDAAKALRNLILNKCDIKMIVDFQAEKVFEDADIYSSIIILQKKKDTEHVEISFKGIRVSEIKSYTALQLQKLEAQNEEIEIIESPMPHKGRSWNIISSDEQEIIAKLLSKNFDQITSHCTIEQGVKTGDDPIYILSPLNKYDLYSSEKIVTVIDSTGKQLQMEKKLLHPVIKAKDINAYQINPNKFILYPHQEAKLIKEKELKENFKNIYGYLTDNKARLMRRKSISRVSTWYSLIWPRGEWVLQPKIVTGDMAYSASFAADLTGEHILVGGTAIIPKDIALLFPLLALMNSKILDWFIQNTSNRFQRNYVSYEQKFLKEIRIPSSFFTKENVLALSRETAKILQLLEKAKTSTLVELFDIEILLKQSKDAIDRLITRLYSLTMDEYNIILEYFRKRESRYSKKEIGF